ncbi:MAG: glycosyltransferase family 39 protein [Nitrospinota bacterium]|nr:glycosyltransferase family 39 protein [Nitrospinota bacterium]
MISTDEPAKGHLWALGLVVLVGTAVRFWLIDKESLWFDEGLSVWFSQRPLPELWGQVPAYETHPPFYYTLLKGWTILFGTSEASLRSLSAVAGACAIPLVYLLGKIVAGGERAGTAGVVAAMVYAFAPVQILYAQEARPYAVLTMTAALAMGGGMWLLVNPGRAARPWFGFGGGGPADRSAALAWLALVVGTAASMWLHNMATLLAGSLLVMVAPVLAIRARFSRWLLLNAALAGAAIGLIWAPFLPWFLAQSTNVNNSFWMTPLTLEWTLNGLKYIFIMFFPTTPFQALVVATALLGLYMVARNRGWGAAMALAGLLLFPIAVTLLASFFVKSIYVPRTLLWTSVPFYAMVGAGFAMDLKWVYKTPLILFFGASLMFGDSLYFQKYVKEQWRDIVEHMAKGAKEGDVVILFPNSLQLPFSYYADRFRPAVKVVALPRPFPAMGMERPYPSGNTAEPGIIQADLDAIGHVTCQSSDIWIVMRMAPVFDPDELVINHFLSKGCRIIEKGRPTGLFYYRLTNQGSRGEEMKIQAQPRKRPSGELGP